MAFGTFVSFPLSSDIASLSLRLTAATVFVKHGLPKLFGAPRAQVRGMFTQGGMPGALFDAIAVLEVFGGITLVVGFLTPLVSILFVLQFVGIMALVVPRKRKPPMSQKFEGGWEIDLVMLAIVFALFILGPGRFSVDGVIGF